MVTLMIICLTPLCENGRKLNGAHSEEVFADKELKCVIDLGDEMYAGHGLETGMNYEILSRFAEDNHCSLSIKAAGNNENYIDSLRNGTVDLVIIHEDELGECTEGIEVSRSLNSCSVWAVPAMKDAEIRQINSWISHMAGSEEFKKIKSRYCLYGDPVRRAEKGITARTLSPYDLIIRKYAEELDWDWRMLAAVIYQESRFSINSRSFRGAQGLMQVMPSTAEYYGIDNLLDPESNLIAGTSHLKRLQRMFSKCDLDKTELVKFTLAAYNAGEGRIIDCRNFAMSKGMDNSRWDEIVNIIPLMREDSILDEESVKLGKFQGHETIEYVERIFTIYDAFCSICPSI